MQVFVRRGSELDCEILELLESEGRSSLDEFRGGSRLAKEIVAVAPNWLAALNNKSVGIFVAGIDQTVMGYLLARLSTTVIGETATIEQVFVTKDARNLGVGDALISATVDWAKGLKIVALDALALPGDRETKNLYERAGLVARLITVTTDLRD